MSTVTIINPIMEVSTKKIRVCAYARVSSDSEDQKNSFLAQVDFYTNYINDNSDWEYVDIYADEGLSALKMDKRDEFLRMLDDCRKGKIDKILVKSISRFSRNTNDCLTTLRELKRLGVEVEFEKEQINTGQATDEMMISILSSMAQEESISISQNMRMSYKRRMENGTFNTCKAPYGFKLIENELSINLEQAGIVKRIYREFISGKSIDLIARDLTDEDIPKMSGATKWDRKAIRYILTNERYMGDALLQKKCSTDALPFKKIINRGEKDKYYVENANVPVITKDTFQEVQALMEQYRAMYYCGSSSKKYPLSRMLYCDECGASFKRKIGYGDKIYWMCRTRHKNIQKCEVPQIAETDIYQAFVNMFDKLKLNSRYILFPMLDQLQKMQTSYCTVHFKTGDINKEIAELTEQNLVLNRLRSKGYIDSALFISQCNEINARIMKLRAQKRHLQAKDEYDTMINATKIIINILEENTVNEFNEDIFRAIVKQIKVGIDKTITFILINDLKLSEKY